MFKLFSDNNRKKTPESKELLAIKNEIRHLEKQRAQLVAGSVDLSSFVSMIAGGYFFSAAPTDNPKNNELKIGRIESRISQCEKLHQKLTESSTSYSPT